ncbi:unnamed protein product [Rotaria socialis]|uniref:Exonuclease domain-containing protein n=1 Tax=Rotaria socialis TaxID=392032 RepID=A0A820SM00_9BILA|nr:unnamed protein product [Rotaria socialis]CAF4791801.1 unnamed protein product [Rotaria socialis]
MSNSNQSMQVLSIDVGCVATGYSHLDRAPCSVAIVNDRREILFDSLIEPDKPVVSDLFPFSGVHKVDLRRAPSFDEVIKKVINILHSFFTPTTLIVGQSIMSDINWMKLEEGVHCNALIGLGGEFTTFDPKYSNNNDKGQSKLEQAHRALLRAPTKILPFGRFNGVYEKVCLSAFNRGYCRCGQSLVNELHKRPK